MIHQIKQMQILVKSILVNNDKARDNDNLIILKVWAEQNPSLRGATSFVDFSKDFVKGKYSSVESITRARRKIQELNPELRGFKYNSRQNNEAEVRQNINK